MAARRFSAEQREDETRLGPPEPDPTPPETGFTPRETGLTPAETGPTAPETGPSETAEDDPDVMPRSPRCCKGGPRDWLKGMWTTRELTEDANDRETTVRTNLRELVVYACFLAVLCILTVGTTSRTMYYYTKALSELFLDASFSETDNTFRGSTQILDFWRFVEGPLLDGLYWDSWYDPAKTKLDNSGNNILYENRLLGVPRMRQLRVRDDSCRVADDMRVFIKACYAEYSWLTEVPMDSKFGHGNASGTAWQYKSAKELGSQSVWGEVGSYSGAGAYVDLATTREKTVKILAGLRQNLWIDRSTRAVFVDFTVYNANINLFCVIRLIFEFPATGGMIPSDSFHTVKLLKYVTPFDYFVMACEWIFVVFVLYYIVEEVLEMRKMRWSYFKSYWNILDILVIVIAITCIIFTVYCTLSVDAKIEALLKDDLQYPNFERLGFYQTQLRTCVGLCVFFAWVKLFKYMSFNKTMTQLSSTLSRCAKDVLGFGVMFFIVFFAFAQLGYLLFGTQVKDFSSFGNATFTLLRTILGDFDYHEIEAANRVLGPIFFLAYVFFVFFVLMNMFLAIINDTYSEVKNEVATQKNEFEVADYLRRGYNNIRGMIGKRDKLIDMQNALKLADANEDGTYSFDEIRTTMKKCNFSEQEMEAFFAQYDQVAASPEPPLTEQQQEQRPDIDLERLHAIVFGDISREAAAAQLRGSPVDGAGRRPDGEGGGDVDDASSGGSAYDEDDDYYDDYGDMDRPMNGRGSRLDPAYYGGGVDPEEIHSLAGRVGHMESSVTALASKVDAILTKLESLGVSGTRGLGDSAPRQLTQDPGASRLDPPPSRQADGHQLALPSGSRQPPPLSGPEGGYQYPPLSGSRQVPDGSGRRPM